MSAAPTRDTTSGDRSLVVLDGTSLTVEDLTRVARDPRVQVRCEPQALERLRRASRLVESIAETYRRQLSEEGEARPTQEYGVTTGFGQFKDIPVSPENLHVLQRNLLLGHSVGVGESAEDDDPTGYFPAEAVRGALLTRLNAFLRGHSGVRPELAQTVSAMLNRGIIPLVPLRGSVGASGDLCPLAHLFSTLLGVGRYYRVQTPAHVARGPKSFGGVDLKPATELAGDLGVEIPEPSYKEGLALTNGTNFSTALLALAVADAEALVESADIAAALTLEAVCGCARALDPKIHRARGHRGQTESAARLRELLAGSRLLDSTGAVQDAYSIRCAPQVHGASLDAVAYAREVVEQEINAVTDNPLFFPGEDGDAHSDEPWDWQFRDNWPDGYDGTARASYSAGNFHGQPVALAADFLGIAVAELASISERRGQLMLDSHHNRGLPSNLVPRRGVNSGYMIAQYTAAGLVSENKVLAHPASVDSIPTSANTEDHVSMSPIAARKLRTIVGLTQSVLAIELMIAAQALDWRIAMDRPPRLNSQRRLEPETAWDDAEEERRRFEEATAESRRPEIAARLGRGTAAAYLAVRSRVPPLLDDRPLDADIRKLRRAIRERSLSSHRD